MARKWSSHLDKDEEAGALIPPISIWPGPSPKTYRIFIEMQSVNGGMGGVCVYLDLFTCICICECACYLRATRAFVTFMLDLLTLFYGRLIGH